MYSNIVVLDAVKLKVPMSHRKMLQHFTSKEALFMCNCKYFKNNSDNGWNNFLSEKMSAAVKDNRNDFQALTNAKYI
jgi:hypothetical protein